MSVEEPLPDGTLVVYRRDDKDGPRLAYLSDARESDGRFWYGVHYITEQSNAGTFSGGGAGFSYKLGPDARLPEAPDEVLLAEHYTAFKLVKDLERQLETARAHELAYRTVRNLRAA